MMGPLTKWSPTTALVSSLKHLDVGDFEAAWEGNRIVGTRSFQCVDGGQTPWFQSPALEPMDERRSCKICWDVRTIWV